LSRHRKPFPRKWSSSMHGQAHHDASQSTKPPILPSAPLRAVLLYHDLLTPIARLSVEPGQYPTAAHDCGSATQLTAPVHTTHTTPTACAVDPRFQTFQSATSLTGITSLPSRPVCFQHANDPDNVPIDHFNARAPPPLRPPSRLRISIYTPKIYLPLPY
jgi:hypothetical protein